MGKTPKSGQHRNTDWFPVNSYINIPLKMDTLNDGHSNATHPHPLYKISVNNVCDDCLKMQISNIEHDH